MAYAASGDIPRMQWAINMSKQCANHSPFELPRHLVRPQQIGTSHLPAGIADRLTPKVLEAWEESLKDVVSEAPTPVSGSSGGSRRGRSSPSDGS